MKQDDPRWWKAERKRWRADREEMARQFPSFQLTWHGRGALTRPVWIGELQPSDSPYVLAVMQVPDRYQRPAVVVLRPGELGRWSEGSWQRPEHWSEGNQICVCAPEDWDPDRCDSVDMVLWTQGWLEVYERWRVTGCDWPLKGYYPQ